MSANIVIFNKEYYPMQRSISFKWVVVGVMLFAFILAPVLVQAQNTKKIPKIVVSAPKPHQQVYSPLAVQGKAQGYWFFEATFPIRLLDEKYQELVSSNVHAIGDWMTKNFVPFKGTLEFTVSKPTNTKLQS
jgi:hypothetical protein